MGERSISAGLSLKAGDWVEVRSREEILSTLDRNSRLDELPFMPQMLQYCGQKLRVRKRAHKVCDTVNATGGRKMSNAVVLEDLRCDGQAYGGCEMRCLIIWKDAWLKRVDQVERGFLGAGQAVPLNAHGDPGESGCSEADVWAGTQMPQEKSGSGEPVYICQATQLPLATQPLSRWSIGQYFEDYASGNARISEILLRLLSLLYVHLSESGLGFGSALRWAYDSFQQFRGGSPYPWRRGHLPKNSATPAINLNLQVGELVRVKHYRELLKTVDDEMMNRGMSFHPEMVPYCGETFRVHQRVRKIMNERTGQLMLLRNECLVLEGSDCLGRYSNPLFCPRFCYPYWREIWLERVANEGQHSANKTSD